MPVNVGGTLPGRIEKNIEGMDRFDIKIDVSTIKMADKCKFIVQIRNKEHIGVEKESILSPRLRSFYEKGCNE